MHHRSSRPLLALLILILASLACSRETDLPEAHLESDYISCDLERSFFDFTYDCTCKDTGVSVEDQDFPEGTKTLPADYTLQRCSPVVFYDPSAPTEEPTQEPTEEPAPPTEAATDPAPLKPYLTEAFTTCDNAAGYVNFTIAEDAPAYDPATFKVTFNGYPVNCAPAANNPSVLTCNYPPPSYAPPAGVQVFIGEELVNEFDFNGGEICNPAPQPNTNDNNDNEEDLQPAPTEEPTPTD